MANGTMTPTWSIYKATCLVNGKAYIGLTKINPILRWRNHLWRVNSKTKVIGRFAIHNAIRAHGPRAFRLEILSTHISLEDASAAEQSSILAHQTLSPMGYNLTDGGMGTPGVRRPHTEETRIKIGLAHRGRRASTEARANMSAAKKGVVPTAAIAASRLANKGRSQTEGHRQKVAAAHLGKLRPIRALTFLLKALASLNAGTSKNIRLEHGRWSTRINTGGQRRKHLGTFDTPEAAAEAYRNAILARIEEIQRTHGASSPIVKLALAKGTAMH